MAVERIHLKFVAAPMVGQSDLPFRLLSCKHGATLAYTQMLMPNRLLDEQEYLEQQLKDLSTVAHGIDQPVVVQLCGNDPDTIVKAGRKLQNHCQGIDLNLGCPQEHARDGRFGAYLLGQSDWPLVETIVSSMAKSFTVPTSVKMRLCQPTPKTLQLSRRLEACGASWLTLHARTVSARRRRQGAADLNEVKQLKEGLSIPVISNGNVRIHADLWDNLILTGADGLMVGETLLGNPYIFSGTVPDPVDVSLEYLSLFNQYPGVASLQTAQTHVRHFIEFQCGRRPWFNEFRAALSATKSVEEMFHLLCSKVQRWRGRNPRCPPNFMETECNSNSSNDEAHASDALTGDLGISMLE
ncbi:FMN-linked oxidoreductase [Macrolepiota fuliginosa MF-IS2]|uniref:tRNA-dihydrouridine synthase n=1 Tax=Macrolepiota fuliginosa MF-IS2 TaxID=1400762 RepID=A0A9P6C6X6_9AGAR|nr:FMN-linked oxidoreductase [Macrolepiota fuliginosa MF-IS2]